MHMSPCLHVFIHNWWSEEDIESPGTGGMTGGCELLCGIQTQGLYTVTGALTCWATSNLISWNYSAIFNCPYLHPRIAYPPPSSNHSRWTVSTCKSHHGWRTSASKVFFPTSSLWKYIFWAIFVVSKTPSFHTKDTKMGHLNSGQGHFNVITWKYYLIFQSIAFGARVTFILHKACCKQ